MQPTEKLSALPTKSTIDAGDYLPIVDSVTGQTKKVTKGTLATSLSSATSGWNSLGYTPVFASNNGNKEVVLTVGGNVDLTPALSAGMKFQVTRPTAPPTTCMAFTAASSQYATKASPVGITPIAAFTCEAWIYVNSYKGQFIISREDASRQNGFQMSLTASGQVEVGYASAGAARLTDSYQSIPLKRWVHIAAVVSSTASATVLIYINGLPVSTTQAGTATTLTQSGSLFMGAAANSSSYFDGYMSEVRIWSVAQSQAAILANMAINMIGTETGLIACYSDKVGTFVDSTANANTLTPAGSGSVAIATQPSNPFNAVEYGVVTKVTYSAPSTTITVFTGTDCNIPNTVLSNALYSTARTPYGFPASKGKWIADYTMRIVWSKGSNAAATWYVTPHQIVIPTGAWNLVYTNNIYANRAASGSNNVRSTLSTTSAAESDRRFTVDLSGSSLTDISSSVVLSAPIDNVVATQYYSNVYTSSGSDTYYLGDRSAVSIVAECPYI